jgi:hypothetical protein
LLTAGGDPPRPPTVRWVPACGGSSLRALRCCWVPVRGGPPAGPCGLLGAGPWGTLAIPTGCLVSVHGG